MSCSACPHTINHSLWHKPLDSLHTCCPEPALPEVRVRRSPHSLAESDSAPGYFVKIWASWDLVNYLCRHCIFEVGIESKRFIIGKISHCVGTQWSHFAFGITFHIIRTFLLMFFVRSVWVYIKILMWDFGR